MKSVKRAFISLCPSIWDMTSRDYSNKIIKRNAWEEIVLIFSEEGFTEEKKKVLGMYFNYFNYLTHKQMYIF